MIAVLSEVGKRLSSQWVTAILLPGLLLEAAVAVALVLGHVHAVDLDRLTARADRLSRDLLDPPARLVLTAAAVLVTAGLIGTAATGLGQVLQRWILRERFLTGGRITRSRWSRRSRALAGAERVGVPTVAAYLPQRPTWIGDRVRLVETRVRAQYHVSATLVWPRLWLLLGEDARRPISDVRDRYAEALALMGWGTLYFVLGVLWWPSLLIGAVVLLIAWQRLRATVAELGELVEAAVDLHLRPLAEALGLPVRGGEVLESEGRALDDRLGKAGTV